MIGGMPTALWSLSSAVKPLGPSPESMMLADHTPLL